MNGPKTRPDAIDTRVVYRVYGTVAIAIGLLTVGWGPLWFGTELAGGPPFAKAAIAEACNGYPYPTRI